MTIKPHPLRMPTKSGTKIEAVLALLSRKGGATLDDFCSTTGWQKHAALASLIGLSKRGCAGKRVHHSHCVIEPEAGQ